MADVVTRLRATPAALAAAALVVCELVARAIAGAPYPGATVLLVLACGISVIPFLPDELDDLSLRVAIVPAVGLTSFGVVLTTVSTLGISLTDASIRLAVVGLVSALAILGGTSAVRRPRAQGRDAAEGLPEWVLLAGVAALFAFGLASAWDIVGPYPPAGVDWGHYLLYADEVEVQRTLLAEDVYAGEPGRVFADSPGVGALYGGIRILDDVPSEWLSYGLVVISALAPLTVYAASGALWGPFAGLLAAAVYAVAPIHLDPIRWHGVGTNLALIVLPLVILGLGLLYRGRRDWRVVGLLALALVGVALMHSTSAFVVVFVLLAALVVDLVRCAVVRSFAPAMTIRAWWRDGIVRSLLAAVGVAAVLGFAVIAHLRAQGADLGPPVSYRFFEPDWLSWHVFEEYYSMGFLLVTAASLGLILSSRTLRRDAALLALVAVAAASIVVGQLWRLEIPFEYRRAVFYLGVAFAMIIGVASVRLRPRVWTALAYVLVLAYIAHDSIGLRLPERLVTDSGRVRGTASETLIQSRDQLIAPEQDRSVVVADRCMNFVVPYVLRRVTLVAYQPWQVGFANRVPLAEKAATVLAGTRAGRRLAEAMNVRYVVANPSCTPGLPERLGGKVVVQTESLVVVDLRASGTARDE